MTFVRQIWQQNQPVYMNTGKMSYISGVSDRFDVHWIFITENDFQLKGMVTNNNSASAHITQRSYSQV